MPINVGWGHSCTPWRYFAAAGLTPLAVVFEPVENARAVSERHRSATPYRFSSSAGAVASHVTFLIRTGVSRLPAESGDQPPVRWIL